MIYAIAAIYIVMGMLVTNLWARADREFFFEHHTLRPVGVALIGIVAWPLVVLLVCVGVLGGLALTGVHRRDKSTGPS